MAYRDFKKTVSLIPERWLPLNYAMYDTDTIELIEMIKKGGWDGIFEALTMCLRYGYVMGHRATKNGVYKEVRPKKKKPCTAPTETGQADKIHHRN